MSNTMEPRTITDAQVELLNACITAMESIYGATLYATFWTDSRGSYFHYRPDCELAVAQYLASVNWRDNLRVVQEHTA